MRRRGRSRRRERETDSSHMNQFITIDSHLTRPIKVLLEVEKGEGTERRSREERRKEILKGKREETN